MLRMNNWQARREQEGPARLDQIHQKAAQEEAAAMMKGQGQGHHGGGPPQVRTLPLKRYLIVT